MKRAPCWREAIACLSPWAMMVALGFRRGVEANGSGAEGRFQDCLDAKLSTENIEAMSMCRNIKTLFNFDPPVTEEEIRAASLQFVRKVTGFNKPSKGNEAAFLAAVDDIAAVSSNLLGSLETNAPPRYRAVEAAKARARAAQRFSR
jgi:hypothetical protein